MAASEKDKGLKGKGAQGKVSSAPAPRGGAESGSDCPAHREVANEPSAVAPGHVAPVAVIGIMVSDELRPLVIGIEADIAQLQSDWPGLSALDRGLRLREHIDILVAAKVEWIQPLDLPEGYREQLIDELRWGSYGVRWWDLRHEAPALWQIPVGRDPKEVIRRTGPDRPVPAYGLDRMNYFFTWYARWSQRLMPDTELRDTVMQRVSQKFR